MQKRLSLSLACCLVALAPPLTAAEAAIDLAPLITFTDAAGAFPGRGSAAVPTLGRFDATRGIVYGLANHNEFAFANTEAWFWSFKLDDPENSFASREVSTAWNLRHGTSSDDDWITDIPLLEIADARFLGSAVTSFTAWTEFAWGGNNRPQLSGRTFTVDASDREAPVSTPLPIAETKLYEERGSDGTTVVATHEEYGHALENSTRMFKAIRPGYTTDAQGNRYFFGSELGLNIRDGHLLIQRDTEGKYRLLFDARDAASYPAEASVTTDDRNRGFSFMVYNAGDDALYGAFGNGKLVRLTKAAIDGFLSPPPGADATALVVEFMGQLPAALANFGGNALRAANHAVSDGHYLYATSPTSVWRYDTRKAPDLEAAFHLIHLLPNQTSDGTARGKDGLEPSGELVLAADGNLYGTTHTGLAATDNGNTLQGVLFRVVRTVDANGDSEDRFEHLHSFADGTLGTRPSGLVDAGFVTDPDTGATQGRLLGATRMGAAHDRGTVYEVRYALPAVSDLALEVSPTTVQVGDNQTFTLSWSSRNTFGEHPCEIEVDGGLPADFVLPDAGKVAGTGELSFTAPPRQAGQITVTLSCAANDGGDPVTTSKTVEVKDAPSSGGGNKKGGGSFGWLLLAPLGVLALARRGMRGRRH